MKHLLFRLLSVIAVFVLLLCHSGYAQTNVDDVATLHQGKAGIYVRLGKKEQNRSLFESHPLIDAVVISTSWKELQPKPGVFSFDALLEEIQQWSGAGKGVVVSILLYGQSPTGRETPEWIYQQPGVREIRFRGGGTAKGSEVSVPAVWDKDFIQQYIEPLVSALAKALDGNPAVWYVMPGFGHIGNMVAQPSKDGGRAFLEAGWTAQLWMEYCRHTIHTYQHHFTKTPLLIKSAGLFLRDRRHNNYKKESSLLFAEFAEQGVATVYLGLEADEGLMRQVYYEIAPVIALAKTITTRLGLGDDWPLWVPEKRRQHGPTKGHDERNLAKTMELAFGEGDNPSSIPTTILFCQEPELLASHPSSKDYNPAVAEIMAAAQQHLKENDAAIFGRKQ